MGKVGRVGDSILVEARNAKPDDTQRISKPVCVDLDGTLIESDLLIEGILSIFARRRGLLAQLSQLASMSRAGFKSKVAALADLYPESLPYNSELIEFLREQKRVGRRIVLATAADSRTAKAIADHLGLFDEVISSDGICNLKGEAKANKLVQRFGHKGFDYVGNDRADLAVWREADGILLVNASRAVSNEAHKLRTAVTQITNRSPLLSTAFRAMRPHQWVKNLLVFVPLVASRSLYDLSGLVSALCMFASFCAAASGIYLVNDLLDLDADRRHPRKRHRPFASGTLSLRHGVVLACVLIVMGIGLAFVVGATLPLLSYVIASLSYSVALKRYPLVDVFMLAGLYTVRIIAGGIASQHLVSLWLLAFSGFTFLSLALVKRVGEMMNIACSNEKPGATRRGYFPEDRAILQMFGCAASFAASVVLALFVGSSTAIQQYRAPELLWALVPLNLFWQCRIWLSTARGHMHDDPIVYASRDWVSWLAAVCVLAIIMLATLSPTFW